MRTNLFLHFRWLKKAPETHQCRYFKVSLLEGSFAEMCKERGEIDFCKVTI